MDKIRKTGKAIALFMVAALCLGMISIVSAADSDTLSEAEKAELSEILSDIEPMKENWGLGGVDFEDLRLGAAVQTYIYTNNAFDPGYVMYPVLDGNRVVLWAIVDNGVVQVSTALVDAVNEKVGPNDPFCIVYDRDGTYLYMDGAFVLLTPSVIPDESRSSLSAGQVTGDVGLETTTLSSTTAWEYSAGGGTDRAMAGDINGDGVVNISDVQALLKYVNGQDISIHDADPDVNGDGSVNISDVQALLKYVNGQDVTAY